MVKCYNIGQVWARNLGWTPTTTLYGIALTPKHCDGAFKKDYKEIEFKDPATKIVTYRLVCPECGTGPRDLTPVEIVQFEAHQKRTKKDLEKISVRRLKRKNPTWKDDEAIYEAKKKLFGKEEAEKYLQEQETRGEIDVRAKASRAKRVDARRAYEKETKSIVKGLGVPTKSFNDYIKQALPTIYFAVGGIAASTILGNFMLFFAALALGVSVSIPGVDAIKEVHDEAIKIKKKFQRDIAIARKSRASPEEIRNIIEKMKGEVELEKLLETIGANPAIKTKINTHVWLKLGLRALGFLLIVTNLVFTSLPFAGLIGLIIGFIAYFTFTPERKPDKKP